MLSGGRHCRPGERRTGGALARPGERRTENGEQNARQARDGWGVEKMDKPPNLDRLNAARLSQRTRRTTKIHKARHSGTADFGEHRGSRRRQRVTESGEVLPHAGRRRGSLEAWRLGSLDRPHAARLSQRTRRTTKGHKGDGTAQRAGRACAQGARPAREPEGAWRASHATLWGEGWLCHPGGQRTERAGAKRKPSTATEGAPAGRRRKS